VYREAFESHYIAIQLQLEEWVLQYETKYDIETIAVLNFYVTSADRLQIENEHARPSVREYECVNVKEQRTSID
jgi:hypothetical protein